MKEADRCEDFTTQPPHHSTENDTTQQHIATTSQQRHHDNVTKSTQQLRHEFSTLLPPVAGILKIEGDLVTAANAVVLPMAVEQTEEQTAAIPCDGVQTNKQQQQQQQQPDLLNEQQQQQKQSTEKEPQPADERQTRIGNYEKNYGSVTQLDLQKENRGGDIGENSLKNIRYSPNSLQ